jgi:hypothetical protein
MSFFGIKINAAVRTVVFWDDEIGKETVKYR